MRLLKTNNVIKVDFVNKEVVEKIVTKKWRFSLKNSFFKGAVFVVGLVLTVTGLVYAGRDDGKGSDTNTTTSIVTETKDNDLIYNVEDVSVILIPGDEKYNNLIQNIETNLNDLGVATEIVNSNEEALQLAKANDHKSTKDILVIAVGGFENNDRKTIILNNMSSEEKSNSSSLSLCLALGNYSPAMGECPVRSGYYSASTGRRESTPLEEAFRSALESFTNPVKTAAIAIPSGDNYNENVIYNIVVNGVIKYSGLNDEEKRGNYFLLAGNSNVIAGSKQFGTNDTASDYQDTVYVGNDGRLQKLRNPVDFVNINKTNNVK